VRALLKLLLKPLPALSPVQTWLLATLPDKVSP